MSRERWLRGIATAALIAGLAGCTGGGSGGGAGAPWQGLFNVPNIYVRKNAETVNDVAVERAVVFGDSYSVQDPTNPFPFRQWNEKAVQSGLFTRMSNYAVGGAEASSTPRSGRSLEQQVDRFLANDAYSGKELTAVFIGFNDIRLARSLAEMDAAEADAAVQFDRLEAAGATDRERRVFLMLSPNYGRYPNVTDRTTRESYTLDWAYFLTDYGNTHTNFVPVDVFTFFERVFQDPGRWGLTNVTTPDPANAVGPNATALFYDDIHFGEKGHALLAALVEHYLTEGWDWANTLQAGSATVAQLNQDIDDGLIQAFRDDPDRGRGFGFAFGSPERATTTLAFAAEARRGFGAGVRLTPGLGLAWLHGEGDGSVRNVRRFGEERARSRLRTEGVALVGEAAGFAWTARVSWGREALRRSRFDTLSQTGTRATVGVAHVTLGQRIGTTFAWDGWRLAPSLGLDVGRRRVEGYGMEDPYVGRVQFAPATVTDTTIRLGLRLDLPPLAFEDGVLRLSAEAGLVRDLADRTVAVRLRQGLVGHRERVLLPDADRITLGLAGELTIQEHLRIGAGVGLVQGATGRDVGIGARVRYRWPLR